MKFVVIDGCPCPRTIAPYVYLVLREAGETASSIYRGEDLGAVSILHRHGKRTQAEIHRDLPMQSNPPGCSSHELRGDGGAFYGRAGAAIAAWKIGVDSGVNTEAAKVRRVDAARRLGWTIAHPYKRGVEGHHWSFVRRPRPKGLRQRALILRARARLPRR